MPANPYQFLPAATIQERLTLYLEEERKILQAMQSYSRDGGSYSRAQLSTVRESIGLLSQALRLSNGSAVKVATPIVRNRCY